MNTQRMRCTARFLMLAWAGFWLWFGLASGISERLPFAGVLLHALLPGGLFLTAALIAWRWETVGSVLLLLEGLAVVTLYPVFMNQPFAVYVFVLFTMGMPPLIAGCLLLWINQRGAPGPVKPI